MIAIADASDIALVPLSWLLWPALAILVGFVALMVAERRQPAPPAPETVTDTPRCNLRCGLAGTVTRTERADLGGQRVLVCVGHADEGTVKGWWA